MKVYKLIATTMAVLCLSGCGEPEPEHNRYVMQGRCYERNVCLNPLSLNVTVTSFILRVNSYGMDTL